MLNIFKSKPFWSYGLVLVAWGAVTSVTMTLVFKLVLQEVEAAFNQRVEQLHESIEHIARDNEAVLEGFSAFLSAIEYADRDSASRYARQILVSYPHVYGLEVALRVKRKDLPKFIDRQRQSWFPKFKVKPFNYDADRTSRSVTNKPIYHPIIFVEPMRTDMKQRIGTDIGSAPFLNDVLEKAAKWQATVASVPFKLIDGPRGYILFRPIPGPPKGSIAKRKEAVALLEVNAEAIEKEIAPLVKNLEFRLYHTAYPSDEGKDQLIHLPAPSPDRLEARFLPKLTAERKLENRGQPFALKVDKQLGWADLDIPLVITTSCTSLLSLSLLLLFLTSYFRREEEREMSANRLLHMATHDALTGLPNRVLLADRFSQACSRTQRRSSPFSVMFIDLNGFKQVNDTYGHEMGDELLKSVGILLKECIRDVDTLSRISGDEFVILLEDTPYENAGKVARKIQAKLVQPILIRDIELNVGLSLGIAVYPEDGTTMNELLKIADERMYVAKQQSKQVKMAPA
ncbi:MAG: diguanylate cyclase domain-containing protein [Methylosarcina sp.]